MPGIRQGMTKAQVFKALDRQVMKDGEQRFDSFTYGENVIRVVDNKDDSVHDIHFCSEGVSYAEEV